jgi:hypothetical protein
MRKSQKKERNKETKKETNKQTKKQTNKVVLQKTPSLRRRNRKVRTAILCCVCVCMYVTAILVKHREMEINPKCINNSARTAQ